MLKHAFGIVVACLILSIPGYAQTEGAPGATQRRLDGSLTHW